MPNKQLAWIDLSIYQEWPGFAWRTKGADTEIVKMDSVGPEEPGGGG